MVKLVAMYRNPENVQDFDRHYFEVHVPLAEKMPGLKKIEVNRIFGTPAGLSDIYLIAEMYFEDKDALMNALNSAEGRAAGKDVMGFAGNIVSMYFAEVL
jgi:uncharacterized protein (TIGR02118 family)